MIGVDGGMIGIVPVTVALKKAEEHDLDLVEISPNANPPVCKILDYGKYLYEIQRREKQNRKKQHNVEVREIRFKPVTATHDLETKLKKAQEFLDNGDKVKFSILFHGRQLVYKENGRKLLIQVIEMLGGEEKVKIDKPIGMEGFNRMTMIVQNNK